MLNPPKNFGFPLLLTNGKLAHWLESAENRESWPENDRKKLKIALEYGIFHPYEHLVSWKRVVGSKGLSLDEAEQRTFLERRLEQLRNHEGPFALVSGPIYVEWEKAINDALQQLTQASTEPPAGQWLQVTKAYPEAQEPRGAGEIES